MLRGRADVDELARNALRVTEFLDEALPLGGVTLFQMILEMRNGAREAVLPPSLHPTIPPTLSLQVWRVEESAWGPFTMAVARVSCRSGVRARGFTTGAVVSTDSARDGMAATFGYPARRGDVELLASYSGVQAAVAHAGSETFRGAAIDPVPLGPDDVQHTGTLNLIRAPAGPRLLQVEFQVVPERVERLRPRLESFDARAWGEPRLDPYYAVTASLVAGSVTFGPLRFLLHTQELAFTGTEAIARS